mmetsp:Transcript_30826/g.65594  ORF Transcript_30826/g.65594 Transcript_30826/m.65594 type:complete len:224 (-) Transcript_30826:1551-2222(-)
MEEKFRPRPAACFVLVLLPIAIFLRAAEVEPGLGPSEGNSSCVTFPTGVFLSRLPAAFRVPSAVHPTSSEFSRSDVVAASSAGKASRPPEAPVEAAPAAVARYSLSRILAACALSSAVLAACSGWEISGSFTCLGCRACCSGSASGTNASPFSPYPKSSPVGTLWFERSCWASPSLRTRNSSLIFVPPSLLLVPWKLRSCPLRSISFSNTMNLAARHCGSWHR